MIPISVKRRAAAAALLLAGAIAAARCHAEPTGGLPRAAAPEVHLHPHGAAGGDRRLLRGTERTGQRVGVAAFIERFGGEEAWGRERGVWT